MRPVFLAVSFLFVIPVGDLLFFPEGRTCYGFDVAGAGDMYGRGGVMPCASSASSITP